MYELFPIRPYASHPSKEIPTLVDKTPRGLAHMLRGLLIASGELSSSVPDIPDMVHYFADYAQDLGEEGRNWIPHWKQSTSQRSNPPHSFRPNRWERNQRKAGNSYT